MNAPSKWLSDNLTDVIVAIAQANATLAQSGDASPLRDSTVAGEGRQDG